MFRISSDVALIIKEFDKYLIDYRSNATQFAGQPQLNSKNEGYISCSYSGSVIGIVYFLDIDFLPKNSIVNVSQVIRLHYHQSLFPYIIDILRNEKPLFIYLNDSTWSGGISTKQPEPVGEAES